MILARSKVVAALAVMAVASRKSRAPYCGAVHEPVSIIASQKPSTRKILTVSEKEQKSGRPLDPSQLRAGRGLLNWSQPDLAKAAGVSLPTVKRAELESVIVSPKTLGQLRDTMEAAGVIFVFENGEGPGVRFRKGMKPPKAGKAAVDEPAPAPPAEPEPPAPAAAPRDAPLRVSAPRGKAKHREG